jgi:hypothetical protein
VNSKRYRPTNLKAPAAPARSLFRHRAFTLFWWARVCSALAVQAESVTIGWQVYTIGRHARSVEQSAFLVGMWVSHSLCHCSCSP